MQEPRHRAQSDQPSEDDLLSSMPSLRRAEILMLLGAAGRSLELAGNGNGSVDGSVDDGAEPFSWFHPAAGEPAGDPEGERKGKPAATNDDLS
jgi:hypothetical protein